MINRNSNNKMYPPQGASTKEQRVAEYAKTREAIVNSIKFAGIFRARRGADNFIMMNSVLNELTKQGLIESTTVTSTHIDYILRNRYGTGKKVQE